MFKYHDLLKAYGQFWLVTITPYARDIEPLVIDKHKLINDFKTLSDMVGVNAVTWRYDPILITDRYSVEYHLRAFEKIAKELDGYTNTVIISFIDIFPKVHRNLPIAREVTKAERLTLGKAMINIAKTYGMTVKPCAEGDELAQFGADCGGCMRLSDFERAIGKKLSAAPKGIKGARPGCACHITADIGEYNTCRHMCKYCYANASPAAVVKNARGHDPKSPLLIGSLQKGDVIHDVYQRSWVSDIGEQISLF
jgi:hypothetical protein